MAWEQRLWFPNVASPFPQVWISSLPLLPAVLAWPPLITHSCVHRRLFFSWSWNGMLQKCCHKLLRSYLERFGGLIRCYEAQPFHTTSHPWLMARILHTFSSYYQLQKSFQQNLKENVKEYRLLPIFSVCYSKMSEKFEHYQKNSTMGCFLLCVSRTIPL